MFCDLCKDFGLVQYRVANSQSKDWLFTCKKCWEDFSKTKGYKYGGTRKENRRKKLSVKTITKKSI